MSDTALNLNRRIFLKTSGALGALAAAGGAAATGALFGECAPQAHAQAADEIVWSQCSVNCGGQCIFKWHVRDGKVAYMETDDTGSPEGIQARACLRGRTMRRWINSPDRLMYPMKRVGKRGEGTFERISWDETLDTIAEKIRRTIDLYGNEAIFLTHGSGLFGVVGRVQERFFNLIGGSLTYYGDYSCACIHGAMPYFFGEGFSPYDSIHASSMTEAMNSDLVVMFGNSPADTRMGGANIVRDFALVRENGAKVIHIDPRMNETCSGSLDEWVPIRTGTDAALVAAIAHEWITNGQVDKQFLDTYCVGYDEDTMPDSAKGQNKSYRDYIMGTGYDLVEKTPEWAAPITQVPAGTIRSLAQQIASAKAPFIVQGWGLQRHSNGESATRAVCMLPILIGQIGLPGTNTGQREAEPGALVGGVPLGSNPVKAKVSNYNWIDAVDHGERMTAANAGIQGADKLSTGIKLMWTCAGNTLTNQHGDINRTHDILADEGKCEFIVVTDTVMTDSAKYADILLPDVMRSEQLHLGTNGYAEWYQGVRVGGPAQEAPGECRKAYDVLADLADRFGVRDEFTEGRTSDDWVRHLYEEAAGKDGNLPTWDDMLQQGVYKRELPAVIGLRDFRNDPVANALGTPSGKIEIYSEQLERLAAEWELEEGDVISPIPIFDPGREGYGSATDEYPLYCSGFHHKARTHSSFGFLEDIEAVARNQVWINPVDAGSRGIANGDVCTVASPRGKIAIEAKVTPRIIPGTVALPQGAWHDADMDGDRIDRGGCANTLTMSHPTPLAKGNPSHSVIVQVAKA